MNEFWISFWSTFFSHLAVLAVVALLGYLAKGRILSRLSQFIEKEVLDAVFVIEESKEHKPQIDQKRDEETSKKA